MQLDNYDINKVQVAITTASERAEGDNEVVGNFLYSVGGDDGFDEFGSRIDFSETDLTIAAAFACSQVFERLAELHALGIVQGIIAKSEESNDEEMQTIDWLHYELQEKLAVYVANAQKNYGNGPLADAYLSLVNTNLAGLVVSYGQLLDSVNVLLPYVEPAAARFGISPEELIRRAKNDEEPYRHAVGMATWQEFKDRLSAQGLPVPPCPSGFAADMGLSDEERLGDPGVPDVLGRLFGTVDGSAQRDVPIEVRNIAADIAKNLGLDDVEVTQVGDGVFAATVSNARDRGLIRSINMHVAAADQELRAE